MAIATPPQSLWPLAWIALIPLWLALFLSANPRSLAFRGSEQRRYCLPRRSLWGATLAWAGVYNGVTLRWLGGLHPLTWMGVPEGASVAIALGCWIFVTFWGSLIPLLWVISIQYLRRWLQQPLSLILVGTGWWCGLDGLFSQTPLYWNPIALTQSPGNPLILHLGRWGGPLWITAALVMVNGLLAAAIFDRWCSRSIGGVSRSRFGPGVWAIVLLLALHGFGAGLMRLASPSAEGAPSLSRSESQRLTLGVVQGNVPTRVKLSPAGQELSLERYLAGYRSLAQEGVDGVLTPEGALPVVLDEAIAIREQWEEALAWAKNNAPKVSVAWVAAFGRSADGRYTQSLFGFDAERFEERPDSTALDAKAAPWDDAAPRYDKVKLVPLGEYVPLASLLEDVLGRLSPLPQSMRPGTLGQRFQTPWGLAAVEICYEPAFSEILRRQVRQGAEFVLSSSNLDPYSEVLMAQSEAHDVMRAIESDRWIVRATNTGYSGFISPQGKVLERSPVRQQWTQAQSIERRQSQTPYVRWGKGTALPLLGLIVAGFYLGSPSPRP